MTYAQHVTRGLTVALGTIVILAALPADADEQETIRTHALAEYGEPALPEDFEHLRYANPDAPKGGRLDLAVIGTFDSLNTLPLGGDTPRNMGLTFDSLMTSPQDELAVNYGLIAETVEYPTDITWAKFHLRPEARFHDDEPITAHDVAWTFEKIMDVGRPFLRSFYDEVAGVEAVDDYTVRFDFETTDSMKPLMQVASMAVYPQHWWEDDEEERDIGRSTLEPLLGSGPYRISRVDAGRLIEFERVDDYWAADLPVNRGQWNFDTVRYDFYRDDTVAFEAFNAGEYDYRYENSARNWATGYDESSINAGNLILEEIPQISVSGMYGLMRNHRQARFEDPRVREALHYLLDFEWLNRNVFYDQYVRQDTYFQGGDFHAEGLPEGRELELLEEFRDDLPERLFEEEFTLPVTDGSGNIRPQLREALRLFAEAGWEVENGVMTNVETGEPFTFEILIRSQTMERVVIPFTRNLERAGIDASVRLMEPAQWERRMQAFDFDTAVLAYTYYPPPGTELYSYYGSMAADVEGSANYMGISRPEVDALIDKAINAENTDELRAASAALDRVLLWGFHALPFWTSDSARIAFWDKFGYPDDPPPYSYGLPNGAGFQPTWWSLDAE